MAVWSAISPPDEDGIFAQIGGHALDAHGVSDTTPELIAAVRSHIHTV